MKSPNKGLTLMEEQFCQLVALGKTAREAYSQAFSLPIISKRREHSIDNKASRLTKRAEIIERIAEAAGEAKRRNRRMWEERGEDLAERLYNRVMEADDKAGIGLLSKEALKGIEVLAKLKGLNAPDKMEVRPGSEEDEAVPTGVAAMTEEDLRAIIAQEERTIDVEAKEIK